MTFTAMAVERIFSFITLQTKINHNSDKFKKKLYLCNPFSKGFNGLQSFVRE